MKKILLLVSSLLAVITLFYACKKDNKYGKLIHLAAIKLQEAIKFAENQPCKPIEEWHIDTFPYRYVAVHQEYDKLIREYRKLSEKANKAYRPDKKGALVYNTSPVVLPPHFGVRYREGKMIVSLAKDLELVEIYQRLEVLFPKLHDFFKDTPCTDPSNWGVIALQKNCEFLPIAITDTSNFRIFVEMEQQYSSLNVAKVSLTEGMDCSSANPNPSKNVVCVDGKASVKL
ncbi:hypothetical protein [Sphingobacterium faecium]